MKKLYCYIDETGQDTGFDYFIVVAVINAADQEKFRKALISVEKEAGTGQRKWHKNRPNRRIRYIQAILNKKIAEGEVFFGRYQKPIPYFLPILETIEKAIRSKYLIEVT